ncbi:MAG: hypothetical protein RIB45_07020 [Marivibrio sp.]|uniref:hypothetical protein n=1 Tax=Marivibrio sp. TaxID=2039719 RepID=UPI0032EC9A71
MPYVSRDEDGHISGIADKSAPHAREFLPNDHPEVLRYLRGASPQAMRATLSDSDTDMARITEDILDVLISRNMINFTDLPVEAQRKLVARQRIRRNLSALSNLVTDDDDII